MTDASRLEVLAADARYHRERLELYRARAHGSRPYSLGRLRELEHAAQQAQERLEHARRVSGADG